MEHRQLPQNVAEDAQETMNTHAACWRKIKRETTYNNIFSYLYRSLHWSVLLPKLVVDQSLRWNSYCFTVESGARVDATIVGSPLLIVETAIRNG